jgi:hypothetical protein
VWPGVGWKFKGTLGMLRILLEVLEQHFNFLTKVEKSATPEDAMA